MVHRLADMNDHKNMEKLYEIYDFDLMKKVLDEIIDEESAFKVKDLKVNGSEIREIAKQYEKNPTVIVGKTLNHLLDMVIEEKIFNANSLLVEEAEKFIKEQYS